MHIPITKPLIRNNYLSFAPSSPRISTGPRQLLRLGGALARLSAHALRQLLRVNGCHNSIARLRFRNLIRAEAYPPLIGAWLLLGFLRAAALRGLGLMCTHLEIAFASSHRSTSSISWISSRQLTSETLCRLPQA